MAIITLQNNKTLDLAVHFPEIDKPVSVACSGGIESTVILHLLLQMYGPDNVHVCTGVIRGRRDWESVNAVRIAQSLGATHIHSIDDNFSVMYPIEQMRLRDTIRNQFSTGNHYIGESLMYYAANHTSVQQEQLTRNNSQRNFLPFIAAQFTKRDVIDLSIQLEIGEILGQTHSCTSQGDTHCGQCYCCLERVRGFNEMGMVDSAPYDISWQSIVERLETPALIKKNW